MGRPKGSSTSEQNPPEQLPVWLSSMKKQLDLIPLVNDKIEELSVSVNKALLIAQENKSKISDLEKENQRMRAQLCSLEYQSRRSNLRFGGIIEEKGESCKAKLSAILKNIFDMDEVRFERVHRNRSA